MVILNSFVEKNMPVVEQYFQAVVNWAVQEGTVHGSDEVAEVSVNDLHVFHSLVFQHKDKVLPLFRKEETRTGTLAHSTAFILQTLTKYKPEFVKLLEKIGSYEKKVSFSFLDDAEQSTHFTYANCRSTFIYCSVL